MKVLLELTIVFRAVNSDLLHSLKVAKFWIKIYSLRRIIKINKDKSGLDSSGSG
jgi:hypothetical protein